jgi:hypothetical protein
LIRVLSLAELQTAFFLGADFAADAELSGVGAVYSYQTWR